MKQRLFNIPQLPFDIHYNIYSLLLGKPWQHIYKNHVTKDDIDKSIKTTNNGTNAAIQKLCDNDLDRNIGAFTLDTFSCGEIQIRDSRVMITLARKADVICDMLFKIDNSVERDLIKSFSLEIGSQDLVKVTDKNKFIFENDPDGKHFWAGSTSTSYPIPLISLQFHNVCFSIELNDSSKLDKIVGNRAGYVYLDTKERRIMARNEHLLFGPNKMIVNMSGMAGSSDHVKEKRENNFFDLESFPTIFMHEKTSQELQEEEQVRLERLETQRLDDIARQERLEREEIYRLDRIKKGL
jgi:hypothetical protein